MRSRTKLPCPASQLITRRGALTAAMAFAATLLAAPTAARAAEGSSAGDAPATSSTDTFNAPYAAWPGYATTAAGSIAAGAVPVKAGASSTVAWKTEAPEGSALLALRQIGQTTYAYAVLGEALVKLDAATGAESKRADLAVGALAQTAAFVDSVLVFPLADGTVVAYDEDLNHAWVADGAVAGGADGAADPSGSAAAQACVIGLSGALCVATAVDGDDVRTVRVAACSSLDGSTLWQTSFNAALPTGGGAPTPAAPALMAAGDDIMLSDGVATVRVLDARDGSEKASWHLGENVTRLCAAPAGGAAAASGTLIYAAFDVAARQAVSGLVRWDADAAAGKQVAGPSFDGAMPAAAPAPAGVRVALVTVAAGEGAAGAAASSATPTAALTPVLRVLDLQGDPGEPTGLDAAQDDGASLTGLDASSLLGLRTIALGPRASEAEVELLVQDGEGRLGRAVLGLSSFDLLLDADAADANASDKARSSAPLVTRDGTALVLAADTLLALAPDPDRAADTPVGGSEGLDTLGGALAGVSLPGGIGLGAGVAVFAVAFGAYAWIRNRGGRARRDEGLDEWRAEHGGSQRSDED